MIRAEHISKEFITEAGIIRAVDDVSFHVEKGEIYGIIGLSGAGKSTLVRLVNRLEEPSGGKIFVDGVDILSLSEKALLEERKSIGMIFQHFNLFAQKTIWDNIAYPLRISGWSKAEIQDRVDRLIAFIGLEDRARSYPAELSGGQQQRVAIARALATGPKILLSDEGTSALDPKNTKQVLELLDKARREFGTTIIMITHQMEVAKAICQRVAVMDRGKIVEEGRTREVFFHPRHPVTRSFLSREEEIVEVEVDDVIPAAS